MTAMKKRHFYILFPAVLLNQEHYNYFLYIQAK